jgi:uncharacterized NAD(P)/FAD-binding protein YdhS
MATEAELLREMRAKMNEYEDRDSTWKRIAEDLQAANARLREALEQAWDAFSSEDDTRLANVLNRARHPEVK